MLCPHACTLMCMGKVDFGCSGTSEVLLHSVAEFSKSASKQVPEFNSVKWGFGAEIKFPSMQKQLKSHSPMGNSFMIPSACI